MISKGCFEICTCVAASTVVHFAGCIDFLSGKIANLISKGYIEACMAAFIGVHFAGCIDILIGKIANMISKGCIAACVAVDLPIPAAMAIVDKCEGIHKLIAWKRHGDRTDLYILCDPGKPHEVLTASLSYIMKQAAERAGGTCLSGIWLMWNL